MTHEARTLPGIDEAARVLWCVRHSHIADDVWDTMDEKVREHWRIEAAPIVQAVMRDIAEKDVPEIEDFVKGVISETLHQRGRWGSTHDLGKTPLDWFWLIGYLAQKAVHAMLSNDIDKAKHHTISTAAALANWHAAISGTHTFMRPGIIPPPENV